MVSTSDCSTLMIQYQLQTASSPDTRVLYVYEEPLTFTRKLPWPPYAIYEYFRNSKKTIFTHAAIFEKSFTDYVHMF